MTKVIENFKKYIALDTMSEDEKDTVPSTSGQTKLAVLLAEQLREMGASDVSIDEHSYVMAAIPATTEKAVPVLGFIAHMDTSPAYSGKGVRPVLIENYDGRDILMNRDTGLTMKTSDFPDLLKYTGQDIIMTDGTTLLGADDKAGIAEIMAMAEYLLKNPQIPHGVIKIGFTPDEEVGRGADFFNTEIFGADIAYTVDGGAIGEIEYENFNAASAKVLVNGASIHPGSAKGKMKNSMLMSMEFQSMLPVFDNPMYTENYEGFYHLDGISGTVEETVMDYIIRDHDMTKFEQKKQFMEKAAAFMNEKYGEGTVKLILKDSYYNMREKIEPHIYLIDTAKEAMEEIGIKPLICPIRGGTDGARLSYMGLPCPNICTGGHNFHGKYEFIPVQSMEKIVELLIKIVRKIEER